MSGYDIANVFLGGLGVLGVFQTLLTVIHYNLPTQKFKELDEVLEDTKALFQSVVEEGLLTDPAFVRETEQRLMSYRDGLEDVRTEVHVATGFTKQTLAMATGLTKKITDLRDNIKVVRAEIADRSDKERKKLEVQNRRTSPSSVATGISAQPDVTNILASAQIVSATEPYAGMTRRFLGQGPQETLTVPTTFNDIQHLSPDQVDTLVTMLDDLNQKVSTLATVVDKAPVAGSSAAARPKQD